MNKPVLNIVLLGDVAAGKATQTAYLVKRYGVYDFDMGRVLRESRGADPKINAVLARTIDAGKLAPTKLVQGIFKSTVKSVPRTKGIVFDGTPKMLGEAKLLARLLKETKRLNPLVIYLQVPIEESVKRMKTRKEKHKRRPDDTSSALKNRIKYYRKNIREVVEYFRDRYTLVHIDGTGSKQEVRSRIMKAVDFYIKNYEQIYKDTGRN